MRQIEMDLTIFKQQQQIKNLRFVLIYLLILFCVLFSFDCWLVGFFFISLFERFSLKQNNYYVAFFYSKVFSLFACFFYGTKNLLYISLFSSCFLLFLSISLFISLDLLLLYLFTIFKSQYRIENAI